MYQSLRPGKLVLMLKMEEEALIISVLSIMVCHTRSVVSAVGLDIIKMNVRITYKHNYLFNMSVQSSTRLSFSHHCLCLKMKWKILAVTATFLQQQEGFAKVLFTPTGCYYGCIGWQQSTSSVMQAEGVSSFTCHQWAQELKLSEVRFLTDTSPLQLPSLLLLEEKLCSC